MEFYYALEQVMGHDKSYTDSNVIMCKENNTLVFKDKNTMFYCARQSIMNFDVEATWYEYIKQVQLSEDEKVILRNIDSMYKWIARSEDGEIFFYGSKTYKGDGIWYISEVGTRVMTIPFNYLF